MKTKIYLLFLVLTSIRCSYNSKNTIQTDIQAKKEITELLNHWHLAAAKADFETYMQAMDSSSVFVGTDASEHWTKSQFQQFSKPYFDKGKAWSFEPLSRSVFIDKTGNIAWFDELLDTWMGTCRGSGVLEKTDNNKWKIKHYVLSVAIPNSSMKEVIKAKKANDSLFLQSIKKHR